MRPASLVLLALLSVGAFAQEDPRATLTSPSGNLVVTMRVDSDGRPEYRIERDKRALVDWSRLGFILADAPCWSHMDALGENHELGCYG